MATNLLQNAANWIVRVREKHGYFRIESSHCDGRSTCGLFDGPAEAVPVSVTVRLANQRVPSVTTTEPPMLHGGRGVQSAPALIVGKGGR